jgi:hypothetical protein
VKKQLYKGFSEESLRKIAHQKVNFRYSVKIHLGVFIVVSILLLIINLLFTPLILWIIYPFFGWLIGVAEHFVAYLLYARGVYPIAKRGVIFHLTAYIFTISFLFIINFYTLPTYYWVLFPAVFWGAAMIIHIIAYFIYYRSKIDENGEGKSRKDRAIDKELEKMKQRMEK